MEKLSLFFTRIKELSFWQRVFSWSVIRTLSYEAYEQFKSLESKLHKQQEDADGLRNKMTRLETEKAGLDRKVQDFEKTILNSNNQINSLNNKIEDLNEKVSESSNKLSRYEASEENRRTDYEKNIAQLNQIKKDHDTERARLHDERLQEKQDAFDRMIRPMVST